MRIFYAFIFTFISITVFGQNASIKGTLQDNNKEAVLYANIALYKTSDSTLVKVGMSTETGEFDLQGINAGSYFITTSYVGLADYTQKDITLTDGEVLDLGMLTFEAGAIELKEATVTANRSMVEIKADRTVFNVEGTVNSTGADGMELLRKAPGVMVDNNDNVTVLGRSGVLVYIDGKRLPLSGDELTNYVKNIPAEQIDRIDIITNPGAKYEAEGNAGIIDIRLKRDKSLGANGTINGSISKGKLLRSNIGASGNFRNKLMNVFGSVGLADRKSFTEFNFNSLQNGIKLDETNYKDNHWQGYNYRLGTDFFIAKNHTVGFLISGGDGETIGVSDNRIAIATQAMPNQIDSVLIAKNTEEYQPLQNTFNINYGFRNDKGRSLNIDADYGRYRTKTNRYQPNQYLNGTETVELSENNNAYDMPSDIDIYTFKIDFEEEILGGQLGLGTKLSRVITDNTFLVFDEVNGQMIQNNFRSNRFEYNESVYAGYVNFSRPITKKISFSAGLRAEQTDATGDLKPFDVSLQEDPVKLNYLSWFPNAGISWKVNPKNSLSLNYGRRINRPDYNVLNPFRNQLSEVSFQKGNAFLTPEIVNNVELGYTLAYRYHFKFAYSYTTDRITRLISPDNDDPRASFITWDNLASQRVLSFNASLPFQVTKWWSAFINVGASHIDNQADYGDGAVVDVQAFTYSVFQQHTFNLPWKIKGELSGYYSGPGVWGGVFEYDANWSLGIGAQRKFMKDQLNVKLGLSDVFNQSGWNGVSRYNGLVSEGNGRWDGRRVSLSLSYNFGNQNVKTRKRKTGLEDEADRVGGGN